MKRSEMVMWLVERLKIHVPTANDLLTNMEALGIQPPPLSGDHAQAIISVYCYPNLNMWEEDFGKDPKLVEAFERRRKHVVDRKLTAKLRKKRKAKDKK